jgi:K+-transporting ATPase A subunit
MVGRTPEFLGKKIEKQEIILVSLALLIHPLVILTSTGLSMLAPSACLRSPTTASMVTKRYFTPSRQQRRTMALLSRG